MSSTEMAEDDSDDWTIEQQEWLEALEDIVRYRGVDKTKTLLRNLQDSALKAGVDLSEATLNTPYRNTIPVTEQPAYPGNVALEQRIENIIRWNALAMVLQGVDSGTGVGGHIATYASAATFLEVGFNHFFRGRAHNYGGDVVNVQAHAAPGVYARAFLEGRLSAEKLKNYRRELQPGGGLSSYPHPRHMPDFWQMPTASMGLSTICSIYQARFAKYLEARGLKPANGGKIWTVIGDGESDEPEVLGTINIASREKLDNLVMIVNCNLQRLDGPVRGNRKIIQDLERSFRGAGWHVIKVVWSSEWDEVLARDIDGVLQRRMDEAVDGDYQLYSVSDGKFQREHWVQGNPVLAKLMESMTNEELRHIKRGGHDHKKLFAAFEQAAATKGKPTVILVKTIKGYGLGESAQGRNTAHQKKQFSAEERISCARALGIPISDDQAAHAEFYKPELNSLEDEYLHAQRSALNGYLPSRTVDCPALPVPDQALFKEQLEGSRGRDVSTTMAMVRILGKLMKEESLGRYIVPIVPDEARTFGMEGLFKQFAIYSHDGQHYQPVDATSLLPYRESEDGQILQEGICEAGAMASFLSAGTAYAMHGIPTIPFYIYYSMFGFQRIGDLAWSAGDMMARGFLLGGTAGRTTLNGEGLQHQDGHSHVMAATIPNLKSYDPAFAYEVAIVVRDGIRRMYAEQEDLFYYITLSNENYAMPPMPEGEDIVESILKGMYLFRRAVETRTHKAHLLGSGAIMQRVLEAQQLLERYDVAADVWSVTSYTELHRDALAAERWNRLHQDHSPRQTYISQLLQNEEGCFVAASDYLKLLPDSLGKYFPANLVSLGTDGYGVSESRQDLRDHFEVDAAHITMATLHALVQQGKLEKTVAKQATQDLAINPDKRDPVAAIHCASGGRQ